ncbi:MATE family efflux transporter [Gephyromycinifex aptenodytis]|uniref:hypothetical protein n=1 Tax=Gephyromycinifex aptenodytis TaxID=2716227 RepID=UPI00144612A9|nr:hypothetical protein [Gephyromycinifex aptenodytis]
MARGLSALAKRASWNVIDQGMSALANMLLMVVVARAVNDEGAFGAFAIAFVVYGVGVAVAKAMVGQPLQMKYSDTTGEDFRRAVRNSQGTAALIGILGGLTSAGAGLAIGGSVGAALIALAPCLPALLMQDSCRMAFFANGRADYAALIDFVRMVLQFAFLFLAIFAGYQNVGILTLTWGVAGAISAGVGLYLLRAAPRMRGAMVWVREQRELNGYLMAEYLLGLGAAQFGILLVAPLASEADVGALRAAQTVLGPLNILGTAAFAFAIPELARRSHLGFKARMQAMVAVSGFMGIISTVWVVGLLLLPDAVGDALFRASWRGAQEVLLPMGLNSIASCLGVGAAVSLYGMALANKTFRLNMFRAPILLGLMVWGTLEAGATGAAWALACVETLFLPFWAITAVRSSREHAERMAARKPEDDLIDESVDPT